MKNLKELKIEKLDYSNIAESFDEVVKEHPVKTFFMRIWYWFSRRYSDIRFIVVEEIPHYYKYGYSATDTWDLFFTHAQWILPRLKELRGRKMGHPCELKEKEWNDIMGKMIKAFELIVKAEEDDAGIYMNKDKDKQIKEGLQLFIGWYFYLWE